MGTGKKGRRLGAWLLALVMICSLVTVPAKSVEAAEVTDALDSSKEVYVELQPDGTIAPNSNEAGNWPAKELTKYNVIIHNNSKNIISDWNITITYEDITCFGGSWNNAVRSDNSIIVGTYKGKGDDGKVWDNAQIEPEGVGNGAGYQIATVDKIKSVTLTYQVGESSGVIGKDDTATDPSVLGEKNSAVTATLTKSNIDGAYYEYLVKVNNGSTSDIKDWIIAIPLTGVTKTNDWSSWATVQAYYTDSYLYIRPIKDLKNIPAGKSVGSVTEGSDKIAYYAAANGSSTLSNATVYYSTTSSDAFSAVVDNANGGTTDNGESSSGSTGNETFDGSNIGSIDTSLDYNFAKLLQYSLYFYDANMCGDQVGETSLYSKPLYGGWRDDCHTHDKFTYNGKEYSAVGGYHDAGDHVKFGMPMAEAFSTLGLGYLEFGEAFDELEQTKHFKTIMDYYCDYVKRCTVLNAAKDEAVAFCYQVGHGDPDHRSWCAPEIEDQTATERSFTLVATNSNPATEIVAETAAALAINYLNFGNPEDLAYAKALFAFTMKYKGDPQVDGSFYGAYGYKDDYCLAAAMLYKASTDAQEKAVYKSEFEKEFSPDKISVTHGWANVYQAAALYAPGGNADYLSRLNSKLASIANNSKTSYYCEDAWGSARINCNVQLMMLIYDKKQGGTTAYPDWAKYQMSMILGNNSTGKNLVCGYNTKSPVKPHHRAASGYSGWNDFNSNAKQKYTLYGALCGGPTSSDFSTYNDAVNDAVSNEVTLDYNSGLVGAAAALYLLNKDSKEAGFTNQTINAEFYGGSKFGGSSEEVTEVTLNKSKISIEEGDTDTLTAAVTPEGAGTVSWKSSDTDIVTVKNGVVTAVKAGTATVTATAGGKSAVCEVTVTAKPVALLEAAAASIEITYGDTNLTGKTVTIKNPGDAQAQSVSAALKTGTTVTLNSGSLSKIPAGGEADITITPKTGLDAGSYEDTIVITYNNGKSNTTLSIPVSLKVNKRDITIKAENKKKTYGEENPEWSYEVTSGSLVKGDSLDIEYSTTATKTSDAGSYPITVSAESDPNYNITTVGGTLTIEKKPVSSVYFPIASDITVGDKLGKSELTEGDEEYGSFAWENEELVLEKGIQDAKVVLTLDDAVKKNYSFDGIEGYDSESGTITREVSVWVQAANAPKIVFPTAGAIKYGQKLTDAELTYSGDSLNYGIFEWADGDTPVEVIGENLKFDMVFKPSTEAAAEYELIERTQKVTVKVEKADNADNLNTPELLNRTSKSIQVQAADGYEYSIDGGENWQSSNTFTKLPSGTKLSPFTEYSIIARIKETETHKASEASDPLTVYTLVADPYVIDVTKIGDENYREALRKSDDEPTTIEYSGGTLTLTDDVRGNSEGYTITGNNPSVTIQAATDTKITLSDATVKAVKVTGTGSAEITISGDVEVKDTISSSGNAQIILNGNGTLKTSGIISNGSVIIKSGTLTIDASGTDHAAIKAPTVVIEGGTVEAVGGSSSPAIEGDNITISGGTVEAVGGSGSPAIEGDNITISGGTVEAVGGSGSPAIEGDNITISGGTVTATGGNGSAAISGGEVNIKDATVTATGGEGAPAISGTKVSIKDSNVTANAGKGASAIESTGQIKIEDSKVEVKMEEGSGKSAISSDDIVIAGTTTVSSPNEGVKLYSSTPKDENGKELTETELTEKQLVTKITLDSTNKTLKVGDKATLKATVEPSNASDRSVVWTSSNTKVATVDQKGNVTGAAPGTAVITVKAKDASGKYATCSVTVVQSEPEEVDVKDLKITGATKKVAPGKKITLKAVVYPENATNKAVKWTVSNNKYASVNNQGVVTTKKAGKGKKVTVTATSLEDGSKKAVYKISIMKNPVKKIKLSAKKTTLKKKQSVTIKAQFTPSKGISKELTWTSSNPKVATVNAKGKVVAKKKGKAKITAKAKDGSGKKATITIKVK